MDHFTYETVERLERFATFLENYKGRIVEVRTPAKRTIHTQIELWGYTDTEMAIRLKDQEEALEQVADGSRVIASSSLHQSLTEHIAELNRMIARLRPLVTEAQALEQQVLAAERGVDEVQDSLVDPGIANLRRYAVAIRDYLDVRGSL